jgi:hypothetical protein
VLIVELAAWQKAGFHFPVRVVHATPEKKGRWVIGCAMVVPDSNEEAPIMHQPSAS